RGELKNRDFPRPVREKAPRRARRLVRLVGVEPEPPQLLEAERFLVEFGRLARMIAGERDVTDLHHSPALSLIADFTAASRNSDRPCIPGRAARPAAAVAGNDIDTAPRTS